MHGTVTIIYIQITQNRSMQPLYHICTPPPTPHTHCLVFIIGPTSVRTVFGSDEGLVCAAYLTDGDPMIIWSTNATGADLSNIIDFMDLPRYVEIVSLNITVDSGYCGTYTCTEKILSGSFSQQVTVDVGESILLNYTLKLRKI